MNQKNNLNFTFEHFKQEMQEFKHQKDEHYKNRPGLINWILLIIFIPFIYPKY